MLTLVKIGFLYFKSKLIKTIKRILTKFVRCTYIDKKQYRLLISFLKKLQKCYLKEIKM